MATLLGSTHASKQQVYGRCTEHSRDYQPGGEYAEDDEDDAAETNPIEVISTICIVVGARMSMKNATKAKVALTDGASGRQMCANIAKVTP